jgi:DNA anti-recombination protein RmuC
MKSLKWIVSIAFAVFFLISSGVFAQQMSDKPAAAPAASPASTDAQNTNIRAYVELLRSDVKQKKTAILVELMQLNDDQAEKFWPIYREYDVELQTLNDRKLAGIQDYAKNYQNMTDEKADELAKLALQLENQRNDLKKTYYEKFREQLGGIIAARFLQIENQMLMVIDLQIASSLPIVEK